jgi:hypothetical protein
MSGFGHLVETPHLIHDSLALRLVLSSFRRPAGHEISIRDGRVKFIDDILLFIISSLEKA